MDREKKVRRDSWWKVVIQESTWNTYPASFWSTIQLMCKGILLAKQGDTVDVISEELQCTVKLRKTNMFLRLKL